MNIFDFINSKDIKEHLKNINYQFNSLEAAWLIYQCNKITIKEKHEAWNELIKTMPDCKIEKRFNTLPQESLHNFLKEYISVEESLINDFLTPSEDCVYTVEWNEENSWISEDMIFKTFEAVRNHILKEYEDWGRKYIYRIAKRKLESKEYTIVYFDINNQPYACDVYECADNISDIFYGVFEGLWFDFPTPFKKGDILCEYDKSGNETDGFCRGPFVMIGITNKNANDRIRKNGDISDMNAWGYFQNEDATVYYEVMFSYMNLEYYRGELSGKRRILKAFSSFIKEEITEALLCNAYHYFINEENTKNLLPQGYTEEGMKLAGFE